MRTLVAAVGALAVVGCAATAPHPLLAEATPAPAVTTPVPAEATLPPAEASPAPPHLPAQPPPNDDHQTRQVNRAWGWVAVAAGADGLILATITSFMMLHQSSVRSADCVDKVCSPDGIAANGKLHDLSGWNAAGWIVAVAGATAGTYLLLTNPSDHALGTQIVVGPTASGAGMLLRGSF